MTDPKVVEFKPAADQSSQDVVAMLEEHLQAARDGEYVAAALVFVCRDGSLEHGWSGSSGFSQLLGAIHRLSYLFNKTHDEQE